MREQDVVAERITRDKELEEESVQLDKEIEQEIRGSFNCHDRDEHSADAVSIQNSVKKKEPVFWPLLNFYTS